MLLWNELRITPDGKYLILDLEVLHLSYYDNVYIDSVYIDYYNNADSFSEFPNNRANEIWPQNKSSFDVLPANEQTEHVKHIRKLIDIDLVKDSIFFLYATTFGEPSEDTPCGATAKYIIGVVYNKFLVYNFSILNFPKTGLNCEMNLEFIDNILTFKGFNLAIKLGHYNLALKYWNLIRKTTSSIQANLCMCHGY